MSGLDFSVPFAQLIAAIGVLCLCLLMGRYKIGLLAAYSFCLYWGYVANMKTLVLALGGGGLGMFAFACIGMALAALGLFILFQSSA